jgi:hypothetical protein
LGCTLLLVLLKPHCTSGRHLVKPRLFKRTLHTERSGLTVQASGKLPAKKFLLTTLPQQVTERRLCRLLLLQPKLRRL